MKYIVKPAPIVLMDRVLKKPIAGLEPADFETYMLNCILTDVRIAEGFKGKSLVLQRKINKMADKLEKPGPCWILEDDEHALIVPICEDPKGGYTNPLIAGQVIPFSDAVLNATDEQPAESVVQ